MKDPNTGLTTKFCCCVNMARGYAFFLSLFLLFCLSRSDTSKNMNTLGLSVMYKSSILLNHIRET